ncbi:MAG: CerR family C-terminal domain-containing protein [Desulfobacterales bacterium]
MSSGEGRQDARERLIQAGIEIFAENGFNATTTRMLAEKAQVNLSAIPYYFQGKEGLYRATVEHIAEVLSAYLSPFLERIRELPGDDLTPEAARDLLRTLLSTLVDVICGNPEMVGFARIILREQMAPTPAFDLIYPRVMQRVLGALAKLFGAITGEADERSRILKAFMCIGQILIFRAGRETIVRRLGIEGYSDEEIREIRELVVQQTFAALGPGV